MTKNYNSQWINSKSLGLILSFSLIFLSSCSLWQKKTRITDPDWQVVAKVLIKSPTQQDRVSLIWSHKQNQDRLQCNNLFGQPLFNLTQTQQQAFFQAANGKEARADSIETLMQTQLGWSLPLNLVKSWIKVDIDQPQVSILSQSSEEISFIYDDLTVKLSQIKKQGGDHIAHKMIFQRAQLTVIIYIKSYESSS